MNYNDLDIKESEKLLKEFFKNNPSFMNPSKVKKLFDERIKNPLLEYEGDGWASVNISPKFRGVLISNDWVIYFGENTKYYWHINNFDPKLERGVKSKFVISPSLSTRIGGDEFFKFGSPRMVDITKYVLKSPPLFINWNSNPFEVKQ